MDTFLASSRARRSSGRVASISRVRSLLSIAWQDRKGIKAVDDSADPEYRLTTLLDFHTHYENFVDCLCEAAQYGLEGRLEQKYAELRELALVTYTPVQPFVCAFLDVDEDEDPSNFEDVSSSDSFSQLLRPPTIKQFLGADDGRMISRIMRTREAIDKYADHLRKLSA